MAWFRRRARRNNEDRAAEMRDHVELLTEQLVGQGQSPDEARRQARLRFGNLHVKVEEIRDRRWRRAIDTLRRDCRTVLRGLVAARAFTAVVLVVLALAMTALTVLFALVDGVMLRPLPFPEADRLVAFGRQSPGQPVTIFPYSAAEFLGLKSRTDVFESLAAVANADIVLRRDADRPAEFLRAGRVSAEFFNVLGVSPAVGRTFNADNETDGRHRVAIVSHNFWQRRLGGTVDVLGRILTTADGALEIVGVMPPGFEYPVAASRSNDIWVPYVIPPGERTGRQAAYLQLVARLRRGVSLEAAAAAGLTDTADAAVGSQAWRPGQVVPMNLHYSQAFWVRQWMWMLLAAVGCLLALAAVNIASLMVVRTTVRRREWALRFALGATRWDIARIVMLESLILALLGALAGTFSGWLGVETLRPLLPANLPGIGNVSVDARTLMVITSTATALGLFAGLAPLWQERRGVRADLAQGGRGQTASRERIWLRGVLLTVEVALAVVLIVAGGMFLISFARLTRVDLGIDTEQVTVAHVRPGAQGLHQGPARSGLVKLEELAARVRAMPGVQSVALTADNLPFSGSSSANSISVPGYGAAEGAPPLTARITRVSPDYFRTLGIRPVRGRVIQTADDERAPEVVVLSEQAARTFFPGRDPFGQVIDRGRALRVVGIVADVRDAGPENAVTMNGPLVYVPLAQSPSPGAVMLVRTSPEVSDLSAPIASAIHESYPEMALVPVLPLSDYLATYFARRRFNMIVVGVFAVLGLTIACVGVNGVSAFVVMQRTKEIGIRRALGGGAAAVIWAVLRRTTTEVLIGIGAGVAAALYLAAFGRESLFEVNPRDPWLYAGAVLLFGAGALVAAFMPARRAARVEAATVLKCD